MDLSPSAHSPDIRESGPSFHKPAIDASRRNYRRHSPSSSRSPTPPPSGGWKRERSPSQLSHDDGVSRREKRADTKNDHGRGDAGHSRRGADVVPYEHRSSHRDRYGRDEYDHSYGRRYSSHHDRSHHSHFSNSSGRSYDSDYRRRDDGRYSRSDHRTPERREREIDETRHKRKESRTSDRDKDREDRTELRDRYKSKDQEVGYGRDRYAVKDMDLDDETLHLKEREKARTKRSGNYRDDFEGRSWNKDKDEVRERHASRLDGERSKESSKESSQQKSKDRWKEKESGDAEDDYAIRDEPRRKGVGDIQKSGHSPETKKEKVARSGKGADEVHFDTGGKSSQKADIRHSDHRKLDHSSLENFSKVENISSDNDHAHEPGKPALTGDEKSLKGSKWGPESEMLSNSMSSGTATQAEGVDAKSNATLAAMRAAEAATKSLGNFMSADQKKRLLWGSKNQEATAPSGNNRWDTVQFADRDRQEKFNKLMGVKGDPSVDVAKDKEKPSVLFAAQKQQELQQDLEKQFTAGLRRRDGRTVGLGL